MAASLQPQTGAADGLGHSRASGPVHLETAGADAGVERLRRRAQVSLDLGRRLSLLLAGDGAGVLGFSLFSDYLRETLGISRRTAQELMRVETALDRLPLIRAAFERGEITEGHLRLLTRVATAENESSWLALARGSSVRALAAAIRDRGGAADPDGVEERPTTLVVISLPAYVKTLWRECVALVRRLVGRRASPEECFEVVLAEAASASGSVGYEARVRVVPFVAPPEVPNGRGAPANASGPAAAGASRSSTATGVDALSDAASSARDLGAPPNRDRHASGARRPALDALVLHTELLALAGAHQRQEAALAAELCAAAATRGYRREGFRTLPEYALERHGVGSRHLYYLLALGRTLERLPSLRKAFLDGRLTLKKVLALGPVTRAETAAAWIERARAVSLRRLRDEVSFWLHLKETRPDVWRTLDGGPLPEGIVLEPGRSPRLHASARPTAAHLLRALAAAEASEPLPGHITTIRLRLEPEVGAMWRAALQRCRESSLHDGPFQEWHALAMLLAHFYRTWDNAETRRQRLSHPVLERDGWRCAVPICSAEGTGRLQEHHIRFRSARGSNGRWNLVSLCNGHHRLLHLGRIRCSGRAPDGLRWVLGVERGRKPFLVFKGDRCVGGVGARTSSSIQRRPDRSPRSLTLPAQPHLH